jgi:hypothetical protein
MSTLKVFAFSLSMIFLSWTSSAQITDTSIVSKSLSIELSCSPNELVLKTAITFLKFYNDYGVKFSFMTLEKNMSHIYIESADSFKLGLSSEKLITLNRRFRDTIYNQSNGSYFWQIIYFIDKQQFEELRQNKIVTLFVTHGGSPIIMRLRRKSQSKILKIASSF